MEGFDIDLKRVSVEDLCGEVHSLLVAMNIPFCREYSYESSRFNFVVANSKTNKAIAILNVKSKVKPTKEIRGKRTDKYKGYGIPVFCISNIQRVKAVLIELLVYLRNEGYVNQCFVDDCSCKIANYKPNQYVFKGIAL